MTWIKPAPAKELTANGFNARGWQDAVINGPVPVDQRNDTMQRLIGRWRTRLSESECRAFAYALGAKWEYDEQEYRKLHEQITRAYGKDGVYEFPEPAGDNIWDSFLAEVRRPMDRSRIIPTPWKTINELMAGGFYPEALAYLGGRRNAGKSAMKQQLTVHAASEAQGFRVLDLSLEMSVTYCLARLIGQQSGGKLRPQHVREWLYGMRERRWVGPMIEDVLAQVRVAVGDRLHIRSDLRNVAAIDQFLTERGPYDLLALDQMQHLEPPPGSQEGWSAMSANSRALVQLAEKHKVAIVACCQINRSDTKDVHDDAFRMPRLNEMKGGSGLEHDAETIMNLCPLDGAYTTMRVNFHKVRGQPGREVRLAHDPLYNLTSGDGFIAPRDGH